MPMKDSIQPQKSMQGRAAFLYDQARVDRASPALFDPSDLSLHAKPVSHGGRQAAWFVSGGFGAAVLRHYRRGGLVARVNDDRYIWTGAARTRSFAEFTLLAGMHALGLAVPRPIAAMYVRTGGVYRAAILIERIHTSQTLAEIILASEQRPDPDIVQAVAQAVFTLHRYHFWHADLNAYNILVDTRNTAWLIDFDKGRCNVSSSSKLANNLLRLRRSLLKISPSTGDHWWQGINAAYGRLQASKTISS